MYKNINDKDIVFLLCGAFHPVVTPLSIQKIKELFPRAQIVLSTWRGTFIENEIACLCDRITYIEDPGFAYNDPAKKMPNNILRILSARQNGLKYCERPYTMLLRPDLVVSGKGFLKYFEKTQKKEEKYALFKRKILISSLFTMDFIEQGIYRHPTPFHTSDWFAFGLTEDIKELYNLPKIKDIKAYSRYFENNPRPRYYPIDCVKDRLWQFSVEQYIGVGNAKKVIKDLDFPNFLSYQNVDFEQAERFLISNFIVLEPQQSDILILKEPYKNLKNDLANIHSFLTNGIIRYKDYCSKYRDYYGFFKKDHPPLWLNKEEKALFGGIKSSDISIVVQGAINPQNTPICLQLLRKNFPNAEIILSTWAGSNVSNLIYDVLLLNQDIGEDKRQEGKHSNVARQIYSTFQGIKKASRKYVLKVRSDLYFKDANFLSYFDKYNCFEDKYRIFEKRILISSYFTRDSRVASWIYHPSDWCFFGLKMDLYNLFDIPLPEEENNFYLEKYEPADPAQFNPEMTVRYWSEQYIFVSCLLKNKKEIDFKDYSDMTEKSRMLSDRYIVNNFVVLDYGAQFNFEFVKYKMDAQWSIGRLKIMDFNRWCELYKQYCDKHFEIKEKSKISTKDISVVVQGAVDRKYTIKCLKSIRKKLPRAEIVLSTWEGTDVSGLDYDVLVLNKDPGAYVFTSDGKKQNQNRQILSTKNGIKKTSRKYVLKIRSDMKIMGTRFLSYFDKFKERNKECKIFQKRILINSLYTRSPDSQKSFLFHPSDWMMFGLREDVLNLWDIPLAPEPETSQYFAKNPQLPHEIGCLTRWHAEQYIWLAFLKKNGIKFDFDNYMVFNDKLARLSKLSIVNNCTLLEYREQFDILCQKYPYKYGDSPTMHHLQWLFDYKEFCSPKYQISLLYALKIIWKQNPDRLSVYKHIYKLFKPFLLVLRCRWVEDLFAIPFYSFKTLISFVKRTKKMLKCKKINLDDLPYVEYKK